MKNVYVCDKCGEKPFETKRLVNSLHCLSAVSPRASCPEPSELFASAVAENAFGGMLALHKACKAAGRVGSLDSIDLARWLAMWRDAGARVGTIRNGQFVES